MIGTVNTGGLAYVICRHIGDKTIPLRRITAEQLDLDQDIIKIETDRVTHDIGDTPDNLTAWAEALARAEELARTNRYRCHRCMGDMAAKFKPSHERICAFVTPLHQAQVEELLDELL